MSLQVGEVEVYESEDPIPDEPSPVERDRSVETFAFDMASAMRRFGRCYLDSDSGDFSSLQKIRREYGPGEVFESQQQQQGKGETVDERFARLQAELEDLVANIDNYKQLAGGPTAICVTKSKLEQLQSLLNLAANEFHRESKEDATIVAAGKGKTGEGGTEQSSIMESVDLDRRLARIEAVLFGSAEGMAPITNAPLAETYDNFKVQIESLNPQLAERTEKKIREAIRKLTEFDEKRSKHYQSQQSNAAAADHQQQLEKKVSALYESISKLDATCENVPTIVRRLHALAKLHEQAQQFSSQIAETSGLRNSVEKKIENQQLTLFELKKESSRVLGDLVAKLEGLEQRSKALQK